MIANDKEYDTYYCEKYIADTFLVSFYAIDGKDAPYHIEVGSHIYSDDDEYAYHVAGVMEETFLSLEFEKLSSDNETDEELLYLMGNEDGGWYYIYPFDMP